MNNKKRSAPSNGSAGQSKRPRVNDSKSKSKPNAKDFKGKGKAPVGNKKPIKTYRNVEEKVVAAPKRKLPLTATAPAHANNDEDDDEMDVDGSEEESEDVEMEQEALVNGDERDGAQAGEPKQRMSKGKSCVPLDTWSVLANHPAVATAEKLALHATQPHRTTKLPSHPLLQDKLLPLWEEARKADITKEERQAAIKQLWETVKGRVAEVARGHKGGRVLQTVCQLKVCDVVFMLTLIYIDCQIWRQGRTRWRSCGARRSIQDDDAEQVLQIFDVQVDPTLVSFYGIGVHDHILTPCRP